MLPDPRSQWNWRAFSDRSDVRRFAGTSLLAKLAVPFRCASQLDRLDSAVIACPGRTRTKELHKTRVTTPPK